MTLSHPCEPPAEPTVATSSSLAPQVLSTNGLADPEQWSAWSDWFQPVFDVRAEPAEKPGFPAEYGMWQLDGLAFTTATAPAARSIRTPDHIRRGPIDHWVISYSPDSETQIDSDGRSVVAGPGTPLLWSLGQASDSLRAAGTRQQLYLPRDSFVDLADLLDAAVVSRLDTPLGAVLGDFMLSLQRRLPAIPTHQVPALAAAVRALVVACIAPEGDRHVADQGVIENSKLHRLRKIVLKNLHSPQLGPAMLCSQLAMSRSGLYRLLDPYGGASRFIRHARLQAARRTLRDPANGIPIAQIADDFCFSDASAFARAYRREFGQSPKEARDAARDGTGLPCSPSSDEPSLGRYMDALNI